MELSGPGVQYIADNQLYNAIITAHAILMSAPMCFGVGLVYKRPLMFGLVKMPPVGEIESPGETRTAKRRLTDRNVINIAIIGLLSYLSYTTIRLTNLFTFDLS